MTDYKPDDFWQEIPDEEDEDSEGWFSDLLDEGDYVKPDQMDRPKKDIRLSEFDTSTLVNELMARAGTGVICLRQDDDASIAFGGDLIDCLRLIKGTEEEIKLFMEHENGESLPDTDDG